MLTHRICINQLFISPIRFQSMVGYNSSLSFGGVKIKHGWLFNCTGVGVSAPKTHTVEGSAIFNEFVVLYFVTLSNFLASTKPKAENTMFIDNTYSAVEFELLLMKLSTQYLLLQNYLMHVHTDTIWSQTRYHCAMRSLQTPSEQSLLWAPCFPFYARERNFPILSTKFTLPKPTNSTANIE